MSDTRGLGAREPAARVLLALVTFAALAAFVPAVAGAEYYDKLGYSSDDVERYKTMALEIAPCRTALAGDRHDAHADITKARVLATLYGRCRKALQARHAPAGVLRVNETMLGLQCFVIGGAGGSVGSVPACTLPPLAPEEKPKR